jgi:dolichol-phosphate mannosyltransferase
MERYVIVKNRKKQNFEEIKISKEKKDISIVIPTYNEEKNIERMVKEVLKHLERTNFGKKEVIIVDDNSKDKTPEIIDKLTEKKEVIVLHRLNDKGIGSAVIDGIKLASGKHVLTMDADFSHPPEKIIEISKYASYDIVSCSRFINRGGMEAPFLRKLGSKMLNLFCGKIMGLRIKDLGGNFRMFNRKKFLDLDLKYRSLFGEFGFEIFYKATKKNYQIKEIPFIYKFRKEGKSKMGNLIKYGFAYIKMAIQLRIKN